MKTPEEKYYRDVEYHNLVDLLENFIHRNQYTPSEIREAAMFACVRYEMSKPMPTSIFKSSEEDQATINELIEGWKKK